MEFGAIAKENRIVMRNGVNLKRLAFFALAADVLTIDVRIIESAIKRFTFMVVLKY